MSSLPTLISHSKNLWQQLLELAFPAFCLGCHQEGSFWCSSCVAPFLQNAAQTCPYCYHKNGDGLVCDSCRRADIFLDGVLTAARFEPGSVLQKAIHSLKYDFVEGLAEPLGEVLHMTWQKCSCEGWIVCPLPLHPQRLRWRGFNQAELLAKQLHTSNVARPLERTHFSQPQMELTREERLKNVRQAFKVVDAGAVEGKTFVIVDDVATTLATLNAAAEALKRAGARKVLGLVLARVYELGYNGLQS